MSASYGLQKWGADEILMRNRSNVKMLQKKQKKYFKNFFFEFHIEFQESISLTWRNSNESFDVELAFLGTASECFFLWFFFNFGCLTPHLSSFVNVTVFNYKIKVKEVKNDPSKNMKKIN